MSDALIPFVVGLILLPVAAEVLVRGAVSLANRAGISPLVVGLTVVAFGTSAPELVVSIRATLNGSAGIAFGNVIGSNIANILLILGVAALIKPIVCNPRSFLRDSLVMLGATALFIGLALSGAIVFWNGALMVAMLVIYLIYSYWREKHGADAAKVHEEEAETLDTLKKSNIWLILLMVIGGLGGVIWGADLLVSGAVVIARGFGVPEEVIGLTMVAVGTSLPELATSVMAALRGHSDIGLGNVIGSNIFNILAILGITSMIAPMDVPDQIMQFDIWVMAGISLLLVPIMLSGSRLSRVEAGLFLIVYAAYIGLQFVGVENYL